MTSKIKKRLVALFMLMVTCVGIFPITSYAAFIPNVTSGFGLNYGGNIPVYSNSNLTSQKGNIYDEEGFTILRMGTNSSGTKYYEVSYSNSTSTGGTSYVRGTDVRIYYTQKTSAGMVTTSTTVYYGTDTNRYDSSGSVSSGEYVCILAEKPNWYYIEYNTSSGRKRGWCAKSAINNGNPSKPFDDVPEGCDFIGNSFTVTEEYTVYGGPGMNYAQIGKVGNAGPESVYYIHEQLVSFNIWQSVAYSTPSSSKLKVGWIYLGISL